MVASWVTGARYLPAFCTAPTVWHLFRPAPISFYREQGNFFQNKIHTIGRGFFRSKGAACSQPQGARVESWNKRFGRPVSRVFSCIFLPGTFSDPMSVEELFFCTLLQDISKKMCPTGTRMCLPGPNMCPAGTNMCQARSNMCLPGSNMCPAGTNMCLPGTSMCLPGTGMCPAGTFFPSHVPDRHIYLAGKNRYVPGRHNFVPQCSIWAHFNLPMSLLGTSIWSGGINMSPASTILCFNVPYGNIFRLLVYSTKFRTFFLPGTKSLLALERRIPTSCHLKPKYPFKTLFPKTFCPVFQYYKVNGNMGKGGIK